MNDTVPSADDSWSSLAQELGLGDDPIAPPSPGELLLTDLPDAHDEDDTAIEPGLSSEPTVEPAEGDEPGEDGKRRRRRRRRRRKGAPGEAATDGVEPADDAAEADDETDDSPSTETPADIAMRDVVANWNVPSWDELIGGLYRPGN